MIRKKEIKSEKSLTTTDRKRQKSKAKPKERKEKKLSRLRKPAELTLEQWQVALRRQFGREQPFSMKNVGSEPIFSDFDVTNPESSRTYRVSIRGQALGENYCSCPDFSVNTLGTCKHVEFVLGRLGRKRGAKTALLAGYQPTYSEIHLQYGARREVVFRPGMECPDSLRRLARRYFDERSRLTKEGFARFHTFLKKANDAKHEVRCFDDTMAFVAEVRDRDLLTQRVGEAFPRGVKSAAFRKLLKLDLYPYQRKAALFAARSGRCLIADDMGLGKTIEAIAATEILAKTMGIERVLIVSPTSLKHQWKREIEKFTHREALIVEGLMPRRRELYASDAFYKITNYDVVFRDLESIRATRPNLIILDEAQRIKNWKTRTAQCVKRLDSEYTFVLTGTPLENRLEELHSIVEFVDRHRLGPMFRFLDEHQHVDETGRVIGYRNLSQITKTLEPILIRRTKDEVLPELPERLDKQFFVPMTPQQMDYHVENQTIVAKVVAKWRRYGFLSEIDQRRLMIAMQNMRMSCNSTYLLDKKTDHGVKADEMIDLLSDELETPDAKVVVFSQWVRMHELVVRRLKERNLGHVLFYGGVPSPKRKKLVDQFRNDPDCRIFLSTDAGGVGLNLQHAKVVVNLDQPWNPAVLEQRIGRVHRLGQKQPVRVIHLIAQGTIEEGMLGLLGFKKALFGGVLDGGKDEVFLGGTKLKRFMESVEKATDSIPERMPSAEEPATDDDESQGEQVASDTTQTPQDQAWNEVFAAGSALLDNLTKALTPASSNRGESASGGQLVLPDQFIAKDEQTGQPYVKLPLPPPEAIEKIAQLFAQFTRPR